jgi:hypothetical protein
MTYFLSEAPPLSKLPGDARDIVIAKVRIIKVHSRTGRHGEWYAKTAFTAEVEIIDVLHRGTATQKIGALKRTIDVWKVKWLSFGEKGVRYIYPATPRMLALQYFVALYLDTNHGRENMLIGFPVGETEAKAWNEERMNFLRNR